MCTTRRERRDPESSAPEHRWPQRLLAWVRPHGRLGWIRRVAGLLFLGMLSVGVYQNFFATTPASQHDVTLANAPAAAVDVWQSHGNGAVRLTLAAVVSIEGLHVSGQPGPVQRVLYDVPATAKAGDRLRAWVAEDGLQVRTSPLPGPNVLPGPQGAAFLISALTWVVLHVIIRRQRRREATRS